MRSTEGIRVDALETTFQTGSLMIKMACQKVSQPLRWVEGHEDVQYSQRYFVSMRPHES